MSSKEEKYEAMINRRGIFGFGFSTNTNLDLMNLVVLAVSGIIVKIFFEENHTKLGTSGPASTTIWGYGLTAVALFLMVFMAIYLSSKTNLLEGQHTGGVLSYYISLLSQGALPIVLTLGVVIYMIALNYLYFTRINSNKVSTSFSTYSFFSSLLIIVQIGLIIKYMYSMLSAIATKQTGNDNHKKEQSILKGLSLILITVNYIFVFILHILLAFFSTDG
jgi:hypothetical protein